MAGKGSEIREAETAVSLLGSAPGWQKKEAFDASGRAKSGRGEAKERAHCREEEEKEGTRR
uniref:Uncharacterized protein n=1 Tax=Arundo donax TaxID=35708 RepID=A0A0A9HFX2_ARUDO